MDKARVDLGQWEKNELTLVKERMRNLKFIRLNFPLVKEENIEVDRSGPPTKGLHPPQACFDRLKRSKEVGGLEVRFDFDHSIHKPILSGVAEGLCLIEGRSR
jgi:hypothetical protein